MAKIYPARIALIVALLLLALAAGLLGGLGFAPDVAIVRQLEAIRVQSPGLTTAAIAVTHAGSAYATIGGGLAVSLGLAWRARRRLAVLLALTVLTERIVMDGLKLLVNRARPAFDLHPVVTDSSSFPSGHSGNSMAVFLAIALVAVPRAHRPVAVAIAIAASVVIGFTRSFLGVHWPSDVIGGWSLGAAIALAAGLIADRSRSAAAEEEHDVVGGHRATIDQN